MLADSQFAIGFIQSYSHWYRKAHVCRVGPRTSLFCVITSTHESPMTISSQFEGPELEVQSPPALKGRNGTPFMCFEIGGSMNLNRFLSAILLSLASMVVMVEKQAAAQTETVLFSFNATSGMKPYVGVIFDKAGNLYGTTSEGGAYGYGTVFKLSPSVSGGSWTVRVLHSFNANGIDGVTPYGGLMFDDQGNLYGSTYYGGAGTCNCGTVFKLSARGAYQIIHTFRGGSDGAYPDQALVHDSKGNLFGTTSAGGSATLCINNHFGCGTVFGLKEVNGGWHERVLYAFKGTSDGKDPEGPLTLDASGNIFGTTEEGGAVCSGGLTCGVVFKISHLQSGWTENTLYTFSGGSDGQWPVGNLVLDADGNLYGATLEGGTGAQCFYGCGTIFEMSPASGSWSERVLYTFMGGRSDGSSPEGGLIADGAGNFYGTTNSGGTAVLGTVFKLDTTNTETILHSFTGFLPDGFDPYSVTLLLDATGSLYGTTAAGGYNDDGIVFKITP